MNTGCVGIVQLVEKGHRRKPRALINWFQTLIIFQSLLTGSHLCCLQVMWPPCRASPAGWRRPWIPTILYKMPSTTSPRRTSSTHNSPPKTRRRPGTTDMSCLRPPATLWPAERKARRPSSSTLRTSCRFCICFDCYIFFKWDNRRGSAQTLLCPGSGI